MYSSGYGGGYNQNQANNRDSNTQGNQNNRKLTLPTAQVDGAPDDSISALKFSPQGCPITVLGCTSWDGSVRAWQVNNNNSNGLSSNPIAMRDAQVPQLCMSLSADGKVYHGGVDRKVTMWDLQSNATQQVAQHNLAVSAVQYCTNNLQTPILVTGSWDGTVSMWDLRSPNPIKTENFGSPVFSIDAQDSSPLAAFALGRKAIVYDLSRMTIHSEVAAHNLSKFHIRSVATWADASAFAVGYAEGRISCHSLQQSTASYNCCFKAHSIDLGNNKFVFHQTNFVRPVRKAPQVAVSGGGDGMIKFWRVSTKTRLYESEPVMFNGTPVPVSAGDVTYDGNILAYGLSYDWGMGKDGFNPQMPRQIHLAYIPNDWNNSTN